MVTHNTEDLCFTFIILLLVTKHVVIASSEGRGSKGFTDNEELRTHVEGVLANPESSQNILDDPVQLF